MFVSARRATTTIALTAAVPALMLAAACGGNGDDAVEVTGTSSCVDVVDGVGTGDGMNFRDAVYECTMDVTDERLVGVAETVNSCDFTEDGEVTLGECDGTSVITNDDGTWEGTFTGTTTWSDTEPAHVHHIELVFVGTGAYDGLRFVAEMDGTGYPWTVTGQVEPTE
jgi:Tfp pilus assembly protein PilW